MQAEAEEAQSIGEGRGNCPCRGGLLSNHPGPAASATSSGCGSSGAAAARGDQDLLAKTVQTPVAREARREEASGTERETSALASDVVANEPNSVGGRVWAGSRSVCMTSVGVVTPPEVDVAVGTAEMPGPVVGTGTVVGSGRYVALCEVDVSGNGLGGGSGEGRTRCSCWRRR